MSFLFSNVYAQEATASNPVSSFLPLIAIFVIFYFLMIRPQKKQLEEEKSMMDALKKGDEVFTKSGLLGTITGMTDKVVTLEVSENTKVKILRSQVGGLASKVFNNDKNTKKD